MHEVCKISATCACFQGGACIESIFFWVTSFGAVSNGRIRPADTTPAKKSTAKAASKKKQVAVSAAEPEIMDADAGNETDDEADPIPETSQESDDAPFLEPVEETPPAVTPAKAGSIFNFANTAA